jgi:hypothetical protein
MNRGEPYNMAKIPARYIGSYPVMASTQLYNIDGTLRNSYLISHGDEILMEASEVIGETWIFDPRGQHDPVYLGAGHMVRDEDKGKSDDQLSAIGYQFSLGRSDFEAIQQKQEGQS